MNLGVIEARLLPAVRRVVGSRAAVRAGPPVVSAVTGMKFDVWVHAARFEDFGGVTAAGAATARRPVRLAGGQRGFSEERPGRIVVEIICTGPTCDGVQELCGDLAPALLLALETMPHPELAGSPAGGTSLRFADFGAVTGSAAIALRTAGDAAYFAGVIAFHLDGFLHVTVARRGGISRPPPPAPGESSTPELELTVVPGAPGRGAAGEHVLITNRGTEPARLENFVLHDAAPRRPHRFTLPPLSLAPGASLRVWTGKGKNDAGNLYWGRVRPVWNDRGDAARLLDATGATVAKAREPGPPGRSP
jgi:hypothetical protein